MKILHLTLWFLPGLGYQENFLPRYQAALGHDVWIVTSIYYPRYFSQQRNRLPVETFQENGVRIIRLPGIRVGMWSQVYFYRLLEVVDRIAPDLIHLHGLWNVPVLQFMLRSRRNDVAVVVDDHTDNGNLPTGIGKYGRFATARWVGQKVLKRGGRLLAVNPFSKEFLHRILGFPLEAIRLLPLGINDQDFAPQLQERVRVRRSLRIEEDNVVFVTSGRLSPGKGLEMLIRAFSRLYHELPYTRLWIIGSGDRQYEEHLHKLADELNLSKAVHFIPWVAQQELCAYYNAADVGVLPGKLGGIKEILAVGKPLIVPDHAATRYFVQDGGGVTFQLSEHGLYQAMWYYATNPEVRQLSGQQALEIVRAKLSWAAVARQSVEIYEEVVHQIK